MRGLNGKTAIVTDTGSGISQTIVLRLAAVGINIGAFDISKKGANEPVAAIQEAGGKAIATIADITQYTNVVEAVKAFEQAAGAGTDILVNNAGWDTPRPYLEIGEAFRKKVVATNWFNPRHVTHAVAQGMAARKAGHIASAAASRARKSTTQWCGACRSGALACRTITLASSRSSRATTPRSPARQSASRAVSPCTDKENCK
jgi:2-hydroxycyclohexanecarboxyl-CoA dehydrogenase